MRILICAQEAPLPPGNGFRLQLRALVDELRKRHEVRVLALRAPDQEMPQRDDEMRLVRMPVPERLGRAKQVAKASVTGEPLAAQVCTPALREALREELVRFAPDVVHVSPGPLAGLADDLDARPSVLAAVDAFHFNVEANMLLARGLRRWLLRLDAARARKFQARRFNGFDAVTVVSENDRNALAQLDPTLRLEVIPNGVDAHSFAPLPGRPVDATRIIFTGVMWYPPNVSAVELLVHRVLPVVRTALPSAHLAIVGRDPSPRVQALAAVDGVEVIGEVPDLRAWLATSRAYACPMVSGTGIKNKLLEAMACGLPCVATPLALQGMDAEPSRDLLVAADVEDFAAHLVRVLEDDELAGRLGRAAREYVCSHHSWEAFGQAYVRTYEGAIAAHGVSAAAKR